MRDQERQVYRYCHCLSAAIDRGKSAASDQVEPGPGSAYAGVLGGAGCTTKDPSGIALAVTKLRLRSKGRLAGYGAEYLLYTAEQ